MLPEASIVNGDSADQNMLFQCGFLTAEAIVALTNIDEENVFLGLFTKEHSKAKSVIKINLMAFDRIISRLDAGSVVYPEFITADNILKYIRSMGTESGNRLENFVHILDNRAEAVEFVICEGSRVIGIPLKNMKLRKDLLICCINRGGHIIIPKGQDSIEKGDHVLVLSANKSLQDIEDILERQV